jgi:hypothetical protein
MAAPHQARRRVGAAHHLGPQAADAAHDLAPQLERRLQHTVLEAEEEHVAHAENGGRGALLDLAALGDGRRADAAVGGALAAVGDDEVEDLAPFVGPAGDRPGGVVLAVVGMGEDAQDAPSLRIRGVG